MLQLMCVIIGFLVIMCLDITGYGKIMIFHNRFSNWNCRLNAYSLFNSLAIPIFSSTRSRTWTWAWGTWTSYFSGKRARERDRSNWLIEKYFVSKNNHRYYKYSRTAIIIYNYFFIRVTRKWPRSYAGILFLMVRALVIYRIFKIQIKYIMV